MLLLGFSIDKCLSIKIFTLLTLAGAAAGLIATAPPQLSAVSKPDSGANLSSVNPSPFKVDGSSSYPDIQSDTPTLKRVAPAPDKHHNVSIGACVHVLLYYGLGPTDLPFLPSGDMVVKALTDENLAVRTFGKSPLIETRNGLRYYLSRDPIFQSDVGESHRDVCLATFAFLNLPLNTPIQLERKSYTLSDLLSESVASFSFDQKELAWTSMAFAKYLPPQSEWTNRFGEPASFSRLADVLLHTDLNSQSCAGTHIFESLAVLDRADHHQGILDHSARREIDSYLNATIPGILRRQKADGSWDWKWCDNLHNEDPTKSAFEKSLVVTGHLLEALDRLDDSRRPPPAVFTSGALWCRQAIDSTNIACDGKWICPFTHAAAAARKFLKSN